MPTEKPTERKLTKAEIELVAYMVFMVCIGAPVSIVLGLPIEWML